MAHTVEITDLSGNTGTLFPDVGLEYTDNLNDSNTAEFKFSGTGVTRRSLIQTGATVKIYREGTLKFEGIIAYKDTLIAGTVIAHCIGSEYHLSRENGTYSNSPWTSTASATIFSEIITESSVWSAGTINTGFSIDFRLNQAQSLWNGITNLANKTQQDIQLDYPNHEIDVLDHRGSSSPVATLNKDIEIKNLRVTETLPKGNHIIVYGKGDGDNQITGTDEDATSIGIYGRITREVTDKSIITTAEANSLASAELALTKDKTQVYDLEIINFSLNVSTGDHVYLNSPDMDLTNEEVRIVGIVRGERQGVEYMKAQVTNPGYKTLTRARNKILGQLKKEQVDTATYMQGSGNTLTWVRGINSKNGAPLNLPFYVPSSLVTDEAGNIRISRMTLDYDVDPFRSGVGIASETAVAPSLSGGSTDAHKHDPSDSGHPHSNSNQTSTNTTMLYDEGSDSDTSFTASTGWNSNVVSEAFTIRAWSFLLAKVVIIAQFSDGDFDVGCRVHNGSAYHASRYNMNASTGVSTYVIRETFMYPVFASTSGTIYVDVYSSVNQAYDVYLTLYGITEEHNHTVSSWNTQNGTASVTDQNKTPGLAGSAASHDHNVSVGDDVSDAGSVNAAEVDIFLDFWNGSSWINKHSILNTGVTIDEDVDLTDSGTYPDSAGWWRVRVEPDSASPDYVQSIINIKHNLDN